MQLIQPKVQKSTSTTLPRRSASRNAESVFNHTCDSISGATPITGSDDVRGVGEAVGGGVANGGTGVAVAVGVRVKEVWLPGQPRLQLRELTWVRPRPGPG